MTKDANPRVAVRAIIENADEDILLLKRQNSKHGNRRWCLPGGTLDRSQTLDECCVEETETETGLSVIRIYPLFIHECPPRGGRVDHYLNHIYRVICKEGEVKVNKESSEGRYVHPRNMGHFNIAFGHDQAINMYLDEHREEIEELIRAEN
ncbi:NUDIX hydrolase [Thermoproteota archaeon]